MIELGKIYNENCLDTMARMPDNFIDLTVTSPPYDNLRTYNGYDFDFESIAKELYRVTKVGGVVVWVVGDATINGSETGTSFKQALFFKEVGFNIHDTMIYKKKNAPPLNHNRLDPCFEYIFALSKNRPSTFNPIYEDCAGFGIKRNRDKNIKAKLEKKSVIRSREEQTTTKRYKYAKNILEYVVGVANKDETLTHTAVFPEKLANDQINIWSNEADIVYDPFSGSGTTIKNAAILNRQWVASEISEEYCQIAEKRIAPYLSQTRLF